MRGLRLRQATLLSATSFTMGLLASCTQKEVAPGPALEVSAKPVAPPPVLIDGSSTLEPVSRAVLDLYASRLVTDIEVSGSGTGSGFKRFCKKGISIAGASRPISAAETKLCEAEGVSFVELPVAFDGVAVVVPRENDWLLSLTVAELKKIWEPAAEGNVETWKDVNPRYPAERLVLAGPGALSGTFDFFTHAIVGREGESRSGFSANETAEQIARHVAMARGGLGYFGLGHAVKHADTLRIVPIDDEIAENGRGPVLPGKDTITDGTYQPLGRPVFLYVSVAEAERKEVADFVGFYLRAARLVAPDVGYVPLPKRLFELAEERFDQRVTGTVFPEERSLVGLTIADLLEAEAETVSLPTSTPAPGSLEAAFRE